jgi:hypothetical protein
MQLTRTSYIRILRIAVAVIVIGLIASYAIWRSLNYARGPAITIFEPVNGSTVNSSTIEIKGRADRVNELIMNGQTISIDEKGGFDQTIVIFPGTNKITFTANDQFGRSTQKELDIVGIAEFKTLKATSPVAATTSSSSPN